MLWVMVTLDAFKQVDTHAEANNRQEGADADLDAFFCVGDDAWPRNSFKVSQHRYVADNAIQARKSAAARLPAGPWRAQG